METTNINWWYERLQQDSVRLVSVTGRNLYTLFVGNLSISELFIRLVCSSDLFLYVNATLMHQQNHFSCTTERDMIIYVPYLVIL